MTDRGPGTLGVADTSLLVVGSIVGAGIFLVSPFVAQDVRSPAAFLGVWLLGGAVALSGAVANGELGGMFPRSGGEYVYLREAYGPAFGFLSGWTSFWIAFPGSIAALAAGFGGTVATMLHLVSPRCSSRSGCSSLGPGPGASRPSSYREIDRGAWPWRSFPSCSRTPDGTRPRT
jgi:amino acid transporter